jgi:hypothetical protein
VSHSAGTVQPSTSRLQASARHLSFVHVQKDVCVHVCVCVQIMQDLSKLVVEQGTILDRIDRNIATVRRRSTQPYLYCLSLPSFSARIPRALTTQELTCKTDASSAASSEHLC